MTKTQYATPKNSSHFLSAQSMIKLAAQLSITVINRLQIQLKRPTHNLHFQSVFTTKELLSLSRLCKMKLHDAADSGKIPSVGYESHDRAAPGGAAAPKIVARNIFFPSRSTKRYDSKFFLLYQLQIVLLTFANKKKY